MYNYVMLVGIIMNISTISEPTKAALVTIRCERPFKNANGQKEYDDIDVLMENPLAHLVQESFKVGDVIGIKGRLQEEHHPTHLFVIGERFISIKTNNQK